MSEHLPYEDELLKRLQDLPLPGEDMAWEDMRRRLEDDNDNPVVPPLTKGCGRYLLLLVALLVAVLFITDPFKWFHQKTNTEAVHSSAGKNEEEQVGDSLPVDRTGKNVKTEIKDTFLLNKSGQNKTEIKDSISLDKTSKQNTANGLPNSKHSPNIIADQSGNNTIKQRGGPKRSTKRLKTGHSVNSQIHLGSPGESKRKNYVVRKNGKALVSISNSIASSTLQKQKAFKGKTKGKLTTTISGEPADSLEIGQAPVVPTAKEHSSNIDKDTSTAVVTMKKPTTDSFKRKTPDTTDVSKKEKPDSSEKKKIYFSAGLAIHQLVPIAGQKTSPYSSTGRKGSLADYIPSVYLRMYREKKWFIQAEFRYGAPQYNKELVFNDRVIDSGGAIVSASRSSVKKTFYNQLPVSFNYFILPNLSLGAGLTFNKFKAALVQRELHVTNLTTQKDTVLSSQLVSQKGADSNFVTTYFQGLVELQYQWKRFSLGARYSFGIQPYLKFKLPGGQESKERNTALQLFIRYELWRSKK